MTVKEFIDGMTATKDRVTASEIAAALIEWILETLEIDRALYDDSPARPVLWRGATQYARDAVKSIRAVDQLLNGDTQQNLFDHAFGEFVWIGGEESTFVRRRALTREEYGRGLALLEDHARHVDAKIKRYRTDFEVATPHWAPNMTFGEAYRLATDAR